MAGKRQALEEMCVKGGRIGFFLFFLLFYDEKKDSSPCMTNLI